MAVVLIIHQKKAERLIPLPQNEDDDIFITGHLAVPKILGRTTPLEKGQVVNFEPVRSNLVIANPLLADSPLSNRLEIFAHTALTLRGGGVPFTEKIKNCVDAGARAILIANCDENKPESYFRIFLPREGSGIDTDPSFQATPVVMISWSSYKKILPAVQGAELGRPPIVSIMPASVNLLEDHVIKDCSVNELARLFLASVTINDMDVVAHLLKKMSPVEASVADDDRQMTAAHLCAESGYTGILKLLIQAELDLECFQKDGFTPLHLGADGGNIEIVQELLQAGSIFVDLPHELGWTALFFAAKNGDVEVGNLLLEYGANPNFLAQDGCTPLHIAAIHGQIDFIRVMIHKGASCLHLAMGQYTALDFAKQKQVWKCAAILQEAYEEQVSLKTAHEHEPGRSVKSLQELQNESLGPVKMPLKQSLAKSFEIETNLQKLGKFSRTEDGEFDPIETVEASVDRRSDIWGQLLLSVGHHTKETDRVEPLQIQAFIDIDPQRSMHQGGSSLIKINGPLHYSRTSTEHLSTGDERPPKRLSFFETIEVDVQRNKFTEIRQDRSKLLSLQTVFIQSNLSAGAEARSSSHGVAHISRVFAHIYSSFGVGSFLKLLSCAAVPFTKNDFEVLKAWVLSHENHEYRQGLDMIASPLMYVFGDHVLVHALDRIIRCYGQGYFYRGGTLEVFSSYMHSLSALLTFWDPEFALHLSNQSIAPELFAIPWFTTIFSAMFNLHETIFIWDFLLHFPSDFMISIAVAILLQMKDKMLGNSSQILTFISDLNGGQVHVDLLLVRQQSLSIYQQTPKCVFDGSILQSVCGMSSIFEGIPRPVFVSLQSALNFQQNLLLLDLREDQLSDEQAKNCGEGPAINQVGLFKVLKFPASKFQGYIRYLKDPALQQHSRRNKVLPPCTLHQLKGHFIGVFSDAENASETQVNVATALILMGFTGVFCCQLEIGTMIVPWDAAVSVSKAV